MAPELKSKKRKALVPDDEVEKVKKVKQIATEVLPKKRKAIDDASPAALKKSKAPKADSDEKVTSNVAKKTKAPETATESQNGTDILVKKPKSSKDVISAEKKLKASAKISKVTVQEEAQEDSESSNDDQIDDQTEALLKGFESDDDDMVDAEGEGYKDGQEVPEVEITKATRKKLRKAAEKAAAQTAAGQPGVVYVGRVPHGFYESEMRKYFEQFGKIKRLRLSRNRKTGASKHFAFVEFELGEVADIVSKTMDNYILFGHILKCKLVPQEQVHEKMWEGSNKRFKKVPWNKMEGRKLEQGATEAQWEKRVAVEVARREAKQAKMKEIGYEFEAPKLKSAKDVPKTKRQPLVLAKDADASDDEQKAIEAPKIDETVPVVDKSKKKGGKKSVANPEAASEITEPVLEKAEPVKKGKQAKKVAEQANVASEDPAPVEKAQTTKKTRSKKTEAAVEISEPIVEDVVEAPKVAKPKKGKKSKAIA